MRARNARTGPVNIVGDFRKRLKKIPRRAIEQIMVVSDQGIKVLAPEDIRARRCDNFGDQSGGHLIPQLVSSSNDNIRTMLSQALLTGFLLGPEQRGR
jgi:hypothetical protein